MSLCLEPRTLPGLGRYGENMKSPQTLRPGHLPMVPQKNDPSRGLRFACSKGMPERIKLCAYEINPNWL